MKKKKIFIGILCIIFILSIIGFLLGIKIISEQENKTNNLGEFPLFSKVYLDQNGHVEFLNEFFSSISVGYRNKDGSRTVYVFAAPIAYFDEEKGWGFIQTGIKEIENKEDNYKYTVEKNDICPFYPSKLKDGIKIEGNENEEYFYYFQDFNDCNVNILMKENFIGESKNMCTYSDNENKWNVSFYPNIRGSNCEMDFGDAYDRNNIRFLIKLGEKQNYTLKIDGGGYLTFYDKESDMVKGVVQLPIIRDEEGKYYTEGKYEIEKLSDMQYSVVYISSMESLRNKKLFISFELYRENQNDNTIYSEQPNLENAYLKNIYYLGYKKKYGIGRTMIKFNAVRGRSYKLDKSDILDSKYVIYSLENNNCKYDMNYMLEDWCSITGNWNSKYKVGDSVGKVDINGNIIECDITDAIKKWCVINDEQLGIMLQAQNEREDCSLILSNDNTLYQNRTVIQLK